MKTFGFPIISLYFEVSKLEGICFRGGALSTQHTVNSFIFFDVFFSKKVFFLHSRIFVSFKGIRFMRKPKTRSRSYDVYTKM